MKILPCQKVLNYSKSREGVLIRQFLVAEVIRIGKRVCDLVRDLIQNLRKI